LHGYFRCEGVGQRRVVLRLGGVNVRFGSFLVLRYEVVERWKILLIASFD
jgi:hypothetical protein